MCKPPGGSGDTVRSLVLGRLVVVSFRQAMAAITMASEARAPGGRGGLEAGSAWRYMPPARRFDCCSLRCWISECVIYKAFGGASKNQMEHIMAGVDTQNMEV
ncbi:hypothetical protein DEO72_LG5g2126 [Vigna unguiculata]|uniref:Uncharacterized protein n=1 Tax=Vigna unguiculata TaxID=3917 RepID=A0A4D6M0B9_VIGUN|nr:hypothetical protein DEO72_LG5g2126 [Vigna unguiculata]